MWRRKDQLHHQTQGTTGETATSVQLAESDEITKHSEATDTEHGKGRWTRAAEMVYPQQALIFEIILVTVFFIILMIIGLLLIKWIR